MFLIYFHSSNFQYSCSEGLTSGLGLSWGTKATLKWVQKRVPDSQPLPSLAVNFFLTITALWSTHSPSRETKGRCSYRMEIMGNVDQVFHFVHVWQKFHDCFPWVFIEGLLVWINNRKYTERETRKFTEATGSGCNKHLQTKKGTTSSCCLLLQTLRPQWTGRKNIIDLYLLFWMT